MPLSQAKPRRICDIGSGPHGITKSINPFSRTPISLILIMLLRVPGTRAQPLSAFICPAAAKDVAVLHAAFNHSLLPRQEAPRPEAETAAVSPTSINHSDQLAPHLNTGRPVVAKTEESHDCLRVLPR